MSGKQPINVGASMYAAKHGYVLVDIIKYKDPEQACAEGHVIKKGYVFRGEGGKNIILGGTCQWKVFLFQTWNNLAYEDITPDLEKIGKMFWMIQRDGLWTEIYQRVRDQKINMDFTEVPPKEKQAWFKNTLRKILSSIIAEKKIKEKQAKEEAEESKKNKKIEINDPDFSMLKSVGSTGNQKMDNDRKDLLFKYQKFGKWTPNQRVYAVFIVKKAGGMSNVCGVRTKYQDKIQALVNIFKEIHKATKSEFVRGFSESMIEKGMLNLSIRQRNTAIGVIEEYEAKYGKKLDFDWKSIIVLLNP